MIFTIFDTETTGLPLPGAAPLDKQPYVCEIGAVQFDTKTMSIVSEVSQLIKPPIPMPPEVIKIHGITDDMLLDAPTFMEAWDASGRAVGNAFTWGVNYLIAHNAPFDVSLLQFEFARMGVNIALPQAICSVQEYRHLYGRRLKLTELYKHFTGREYAHKHRAVDDSKALLEALLAANFFDNFPEPEPIISLDAMLETYKEKPSEKL